MFDRVTVPEAARFGRGRPVVSGFRLEAVWKPVHVGASLRHPGECGQHRFGERNAGKPTGRIEGGQREILKEGISMSMIHAETVKAVQELLRDRGIEQHENETCERAGKWSFYRMSCGGNCR